MQSRLKGQKCTACRSPDYYRTCSDFSHMLTKLGQRWIPDTLIWVLLLRKQLQYDNQKLLAMHVLSCYLLCMFSPVITWTTQSKRAWRLAIIQSILAMEGSIINFIPAASHKIRLCVTKYSRQRKAAIFTLQLYTSNKMSIHVEIFIEQQEMRG